jgi:hypothetical protein
MLLSIATSFPPKRYLCYARIIQKAGQLSYAAEQFNFSMRTTHASMLCNSPNNQNKQTYSILYLPSTVLPF